MTQPNLAKPIDIINRELTFVEVLEYFEVEAAVNLPAIKPKGGEIYLHVFTDNKRS